MKAPTSKTNEAGFTLVSVLMDFGLLGLAALALGGLVVYNRTSEMRLKRRTQGDQALVNALTSLQAMPFDSLHDYCVSKSALNLTRPTICQTATGQISNQPEVQPGTDPFTGAPKFVDVLKDWNGDSNAKGLACVELVSCIEQAGSQLLAVTVRGIWTDPTNQAGQAVMAPQLLTIRKAR